MVHVEDVILSGERAELYITFMSDIHEIGTSADAVVEVGRLLCSALRDGCNTRRWATLDDRLAALLAAEVPHANQLAAIRLQSYLQENREAQGR